MFTGIVEGHGTIYRVKKGAARSRDLRLEIDIPRVAARVQIGSSVAVNGVCLTVAQKIKNKCCFDVVPETQKRSTLGTFQTGQRVNIELPLRWQGRVGGHFVLGHVDGVGRVVALRSTRGGRSAKIGFPLRLRKFIVEKGSIAIDGTSLTLGACSQNTFWVHLIPQTLKETNLDTLTPGSRVNLEVDYAAKLLRK